MEYVDTNARERQTTNIVDWKVRVKEEAMQFANLTSLHGIQYIARGGLIRRTIWVILFFSMFFYLVYTIVELCERYLAYNYVTSVKVERSHQVPFPAITICLKASFDLERLQRSPRSKVIKDYLTSLSDAGDLFSHAGSLNWSDPSVSEVLQNMTFRGILDAFSYTKDDIFVYGEQKRLHQWQNKTVEFETTNELNSRCFTFNGLSTKDKIFMSAVDSVDLILRIPNSGSLPETLLPGIWVSVHNPNETPSPFQRMDITPGSYAQIIVFLYKYHYLPAPYSTFENKDCLETEAHGFKSPLIMYPNYTWSNCFMESVIKTINHKCNCNLEQDSAESPECNIQTFETCIKPTALQELAHHLVARDNACMATCTYLEYQTTWSVVPLVRDSTLNALVKRGLLNNSTTSELIYLKVQLGSPQIVTMEHHPAMTVDDIYSILGGQMGLFLGASLLTFAEVLEVCTLFVISYVESRKTKSSIRHS